MKTIVLAGMPGSGKTTVGKILSDSLKADFVDIDSEIERLENAPRDSVLTVRYYKNKDGVITTALSSVSNQVHECRPHTCRAAWNFIKQFRK